MNRRLLIMLFVCDSFLGFAQSDSLTFVNTSWQTQKVCRGILWKRYLFNGNIFGSNQSINILEITKPRKIKFDFAYEPKELKPTSQFGKEARAIAALNGTFFDIKNGGAVDFMRIRNQIISQNQMKDNKRGVHHKAALIINNGRMQIAKWNGREDWEAHLMEGDVMESGPLLIFHKQIEAIDSSSFSLTRHPRTAVVITTSGHVLLITIDGRHENAAGMSLFELSKILKWLNAFDGINLDGGGSTTLWIANQADGGVVNHPCDNKLWDHAGERKVANAIVVHKKEKSKK